MATNTKKAPASTSPSLAHALKSTPADVKASISDWAGFVRTVPSSVGTPTELVEGYFGVREQSLARRRRRALELVGAAPKVHLSVPKVQLPRRKSAEQQSVIEAV